MQTELTINLHIHTRYSDGTGLHTDVVQAAIKAGLDVVITTDHNLLVDGMEGYHQSGSQRVLLLTGEEVHDRTANPAKNHMLVLGAGKELSSLGSSPQRLIDQVNRAGGVTFLAHPYDPELPAFHEGDYSWEDWSVQDYTGLEIWNGLSELKVRAHGKWDTIFYALFPQNIAHGPPQQTLKKWDELLVRGARVVAVGGSDAHALHLHFGPFKRTVFPYEFHFNAINTHILTHSPLTGDLLADRRMIYDALRHGHAFVGYDLPAPTHGFRFTAKGRERAAHMGEEIHLADGITLQVRLPTRADCHLLKDGQIIQKWRNQDICTRIINQPGVYRVECYIDYLGKKRGWIYSNPIYVRDKK